MDAGDRSDAAEEPRLLEQHHGGVDISPPTSTWTAIGELYPNPKDAFNTRSDNVNPSTSIVRVYHSNLVQTADSNKSHEGSNPGGGNDAEGISQTAENEHSNNAADTTTQLVRLHKKLQRNRNEIILLQAQLSTETQRFLDKSRFVNESVSATVDRYCLGRTRQIDASEAAGWESLQTQLRGDRVALSGQFKSLIDATSQLNSAQYWLSRTENNFMGTFYTLLNQLPEGEHLLEQLKSFDEAECVSLASRSDDIPELAQDYFDKVGDTALLEDEIGDLDQIYDEEREKRDLLRDQDQEPSLPDEKFDQQYDSERKGKEGRLEQYRREVFVLQAECERSGIDLEALRHRSQLHRTTASDLQATQLLDPISSDVAESLIQPVEVSKDSVVSESSTLGIRRWLDDVQHPLI